MKIWEALKQGMRPAGLAAAAVAALYLGGCAANTPVGCLSDPKGFDDCMTRPGGPALAGDAKALNEMADSALCNEEGEVACLQRVGLQIRKMVISLYGKNLPDTLPGTYAVAATEVATRLAMLGVEASTEVAFLAQGDGASLRAHHGQTPAYAFLPRDAYGVQVAFRE